MGQAAVETAPFLEEVCGLDFSKMPLSDKFVYTGAKFPCFYGPFRCGKTYAACFKAIRLSMEFPGNFGWIARGSYPKLRDTTVRAFLEICPKHLFAKQFNDSKLEAKLKAIGGGTSDIVFRHLDQIDVDEIKNLDLGFFFLDQAEETTEKIYELFCGRLTRTCAGHRPGFIVANPNGHDWIWKTWINVARPGLRSIRLCPKCEEKMILLGKEENYRYKCPKCKFVGSGIPDIEPLEGDPGPGYELLQSTDTEDNPYLVEDYKQTLIAMYPDAMVRRYVFGSSDVLEDVCLAEFDENVHFITPFEIPETWYMFTTTDPAVRGTTCTCLWAIDWDGNLYCVDMYYEKGALCSEDAVALLKMAPDVKTRLADPAAFSKVISRGSRFLSIADEYREAGVVLTPARKVKEIAAAINHLNEFLKQRKIFWFKGPCQPFANEAGSVKWKDLRPTEVGVKEPPEEVVGEKHAIDCAIMAVTWAFQAPKIERPKTTHQKLIEKFTKRRKVADEHMGTEW